MLEVLGLPAAEQRLYEQLLTQPPSTLAQLAESAAGPAGQAELKTMLDTLEELGLVAWQPGDPPRYAVVPPRAALDALVATRTRELAEARQWLRELTARFHDPLTSQDPRELIELVIGRENILQRWKEVQRSARREICAFDTPPYVADPTTANPIELDLLRSGIRYRVLYDRSALDLPGVVAHIEHGLTAGETARVGDVPMKLVLSDAPLALLPLRLDPVDTETSLVVHDSALLEALQALFEMSWTQAVPLRVQHSPPTASSGEPTTLERKLLLLLLAGLTDRAIAAHLGQHERTVTSHVRQLLIKLDCATRFQAGYQAVLRGWLEEAHADE